MKKWLIRKQLIGMLLAISHLPDLILPGKIEPEIKWSEMPVFSWVWVEDILNCTPVIRMKLR